jgi:hypothetical protein
MITYPGSATFINSFLISSELKMSVHPQALVAGIVNTSSHNLKICGKTQNKTSTVSRNTQK